LFFVVSSSIQKFRYLKPALSFILVFVGVKMVLEKLEWLKIHPAVSLMVIVFALVIAGFASARANRREAEKAEGDGPVTPEAVGVAAPAEPPAVPAAAPGVGAPGDGRSEGPGDGASGPVVEAKDAARAAGPDAPA
jgi:hypothetical protein